MLIYLFMMWIVFLSITAGVLLYKNYQDHQILGITLSARHAREKQVQSLLQKYKTACYLTLVGFTALSLVMLLDSLQAYGEFIMLAIIFLNIFINWQIINHYRKKLATLKEENGWKYATSRVVAVDINVSREKGKAGVSPLWSWLFVFLSALPAIWIVSEPGRAEYFPPLFLLLGPVIQLTMVYLFYRMRAVPTPVRSENSEDNLSCAREQERINTLSATLAGLALLLFWVVFCGLMFYRQNALLIIILTGVLTAAMLAIGIWQQKAVRKNENRYFGLQNLDDDQVTEQPAVWRWGFYYNPDDHRVMVPKRVASMGWTINLARPAGKAAGLGLLVFLVIIMGLLAYMSVKDYTFTANGEVWTMDAPLYKMAFQKDQVASVTLIDSLPYGTRTSGFGGSEKSYGRFTMDGYGKSMLYVYNNSSPYIVIELQGFSPSWVIANCKTPEETGALYKSILTWWQS